MAVVLVEFETPVIAENGRIYSARACGADIRDGTGHWQGWIEFIPADGGPVIRSRRETTQPNREDAEYWATGLTAVYLEGSLERALNPLTRPTRVTKPKPAFDEPAPDLIPADAPRAVSVLNPFSVYEKGEPLLRSQLAALSEWHLLNIIRAYDLSDLDDAALRKLPAAALVELIVGEVRQQSPATRP